MRDVILLRLLATIALSTTLASEPARAGGKCTAFVLNDLKDTAEDYERCLKQTVLNGCDAQLERHARYLAAVEGPCAGTPELARAQKAFEAARVHIGELQQQARARADSRNAEAEALVAAFRKLTAQLGDEDAMNRRHGRPKDEDLIRLAARSDTAFATTQDELAALEAQAAQTRAKHGELRIVVDVEKRLPLWRRLLADERAAYEAERPVLDHVIAGKEGFTEEDSLSPARVAEAFKRLGATHLLQVAATSTSQTSPLFDFAPAPGSLPRPRADRPAQPKYDAKYETQGAGAWVTLTPLTQAELPLKTPVLVWSLAGNGERFIAVTPDGGRYAAPLRITQDGKAVVVVEKADPGALRFSPLRDKHPRYEDYKHAFGDVPKALLAKIEAQAKSARVCHDKVADRFVKKRDPLAALHEDLLSRGLVAESVFRKIEKLDDQERAAHEKDCRPARTALVTAVKAAQAAYVKARQKAWQQTAKALKIKAAP